MVMPLLLAWMKKQCHRLRLGIDASEIGTLVKIAVDTGEAEVRIVITASMLERAYVLDVKGSERRIFLMGLAILAPMTRALPDKGSRGGIHAALPDLNFLASRRRTATNLLALT
jgi:hypothetical protein